MSTYKPYLEFIRYTLNPEAQLAMDHPANILIGRVYSCLLMSREFLD